MSNKTALERECFGLISTFSLYPALRLTLVSVKLIESHLFAPSHTVPMIANIKSFEGCWRCPRWVMLLGWTCSRSGFSLGMLAKTFDKTSNSEGNRTLRQHTWGCSFDPVTWPRILFFCVFSPGCMNWRSSVSSTFLHDTPNDTCEVGLGNTLDRNSASLDGRELFSHTQWLLLPLVVISVCLLLVTTLLFSPLVAG